MHEMTSHMARESIFKFFDERMHDFVHGDEQPEVAEEAIEPQPDPVPHQYSPTAKMVSSSDLDEKKEELKENGMKDNDSNDFIRYHKDFMYVCSRWVVIEY